MKEEERMSIIRRYIRNPLFNDFDLYYNEISAPCCDLSNKVHVACSVLAEWKKQKKELENLPIKKRFLVPFPDQIPKSKRTIVPIPNPLFKTRKSLNNNNSPEKTEMLLKDASKTNIRLTFKLGKNNSLSFKKSNEANIIPQKRPQNEAKDEDTRVIKKMKIEENHSPVESIIENRNIRARLEKYNAVLVIKKNLTKTDVEKNNQRLSIPESQIISPNFLNEDEISRLTYKLGEKTPNIIVTLIDPTGKECEAKLARWRMRTRMVFNIFGSWKKVVARNNLRENMPIEVYSFREGPHLYFAVTKV